MKLDYYSIMDEILSYIKENNLKCGDKLPGERYFSACMNIHRNQVRKALTMLVESKYLYLKPRSGYFVNHMANPIDVSDLNSFFDLEAKNLKIISFKLTKSDPHISSRMKIENNSSIHHIIINSNNFDKQNFLIQIFIEEDQNFFDDTEDTLETIKELITFNKYSSGRIYLREANQLELMFMNLKENTKVCRLTKQLITKNNKKCYIEFSLLATLYEFIGW